MIEEILYRGSKSQHWEKKLLGLIISFLAGLAYSGSSGKDFFAEKYRMINENSTYGLKTMSDIKEIR